MKYKSLLFDLDGTITDSAEGVVNGVLYSLEKLNVPVEEGFDTKKLVGPPLLWSYKKYFGLSDEESERALTLYREYYTPKGIYENSVFEGMEDTLKSLYEHGYDMLIATSKPTPQAQTVMDHFGLTKYFSFIAGCPLKETGVTKADVIRYAFEHTATKNKDEIIMIGDTCFDINGAIECGIDSMGVLYGMGEPDELEKATYVVKNVEELKNFFMK